MNIEIRHATKKDIPEIGKLFSKVYTTPDFDGFTLEKSIEYMNWLFGRCPEVAFVAVDGNKIVGARLAGTKPWFDGIHIVDGEIFVGKDYRGQGIGLRLTEKSFEAAKKLGATVVDSATFIQGKHTESGWDIQPQFLNLEWHKKNGFHVIEQMAIISGDIDELINKTKEHIAEND